MPPHRHFGLTPNQHSHLDFIPRTARREPIRSRAWMADYGWFFVIGLLYAAGIIAIIIYASTSARSRELYEGQYAQVDPSTRKWFRDQISPKTGGNCCTEADGEYAEEDIRNGHYWARFPKSQGKWIEVLDEVVIHDPNRNGAPVVWWYWDNNPALRGGLELKIRCFAPGGGF